MRRRASGFGAIEKRIDELIRRCRRIPPSEIMQLLLRADANPRVDIQKEFEQLRRKYETEGA